MDKDISEEPLAPEQVKFLRTVNTKRLGAGMSTTTGSYEFPAVCEVRDADWGHMDQAHRLWIHKTYTESLRLSTGRNFAVSVTTLRFFGFPVFVMLSDVSIEP